MRAVVAVLLAALPAAAQTPPGEPRRLPFPTGQATPAEATPPEGQRTGPKPDPSVVLPRPEQLAKIDAGLLVVRFQGGGSQLWCGPALVRDFGTDGRAAQDTVTVLRALRPTEWGGIGSPRPVVEYGLRNGEPTAWNDLQRYGTPIDLKTVRAEPVRGAWVVRDEANIHLNFGPHRADAEQAAAVARRHGFNRVGRVGLPGTVLTFFYLDPNAGDGKPGTVDAFVELTKASQEANLVRTAVDVPGIGLVGERLQLDPRQLDARKDRGEWVLANGPDVLARFGYSEMAARDALRVVKEARLTEFCRVGGVTFFLSHGQPPTRISYAALGVRFDPDRLSAREIGPGQWGVSEGPGRVLFPAASRDEAEMAVKVIRAYKFDQVCQVGASPKASLRFLAKTGR
jgi:hypothetical protein